MTASLMSLPCLSRQAHCSCPHPQPPRLPAPTLPHTQSPHHLIFPRSSHTCFAPHSSTSTLHPHPLSLITILSSSAPVLHFPYSALH
ncbi:hypothetical protein E2C01_000254 [Portunus trituberculatus]|uniref:Uncharacterized protein n=1 Tax=Portunus trituberculatus TaxID=210409 RepID=A0A5B7CDU2_PORTR|nr:hypothetical protein [Portunus trituberculatus]